MVCKQVLVGGRVQGVFFRVSTRDKAGELGLAGGVRNLRDGRVEITVSGDSAIVDDLIKWLKTGPKYAKVSTIEVIDCPQNLVEHIRSDYFEIWSTR